MTVNRTRDKAVLVRLTIGLPGSSKQDKEATKEVQHYHGTKAAKVSKQLWPDDALKAIKELEGIARTYHDEHTLPWNDRRFLPQRHFLEYSGEMRKLGGKFQALSKKFLANYDLYKTEAKTMLNGLYREEDYPTLEKLTTRFRWELSFEPIPEGKDLRLDLAEEELMHLQSELDNRIEAAIKTAQIDLYRRLGEPLAKMAKTLSDPEKNFHKTLVGNLKEACELIPKLSLEDPMLEALVKQAEALTVHRPDTLKTDKRIRSDIAKRADEMVNKMKGYYAPAKLREPGLNPS